MNAEPIHTRIRGWTVSVTPKPHLIFFTRWHLVISRNAIFEENDGQTVTTGVYRTRVDALLHALKITAAFDYTT